MTEAQLAATKDLLFVITLSATITYGFLVAVFYHLGKIISKLDLVLRKLNNQLPDDEGGR